MGPCSSAKTILIVDDDLNAREAMGKLLHERGYIARGAFNGREALASTVIGDTIATSFSSYCLCSAARQWTSVVAKVVLRGI